MFPVARRERAAAATGGGGGGRRQKEGNESSSMGICPDGGPGPKLRGGRARKGVRATYTYINAHGVRDISSKSPSEKREQERERVRDRVVSQQRPGVYIKTEGDNRRCPPYYRHLSPLGREKYSPKLDPVFPQIGRGHLAALCTPAYRLGDGFRDRGRALVKRGGIPEERVGKKRARRSR